MNVIGRLIILLLSGMMPVAAAAHAEAVNVFAAASLKTALDEIGGGWTASSGKRAAMVYAGTPALAKQIANGAPADVFISADIAWMDELESKRLIEPATRRNLLGNTLVLIAPRDSAVSADFGTTVDLAALLAGGKLAIADVKAVPAGKYARAALESLKLWSSVEPSLAQAENVRAALALVARGEAPLGIVYGSDAKAEPAVRVVAVFPKSSYPAIIYPVALVANAPSPDAPAFLDYLLSPQARSAFERNGFSVPD